MVLSGRTGDCSSSFQHDNSPKNSGSYVIPWNTWIDLCTTPMFKATIRSLHRFSRTNLWSTRGTLKMLDQGAVHEIELVVNAGEHLCNGLNMLSPQFSMGSTTSPIQKAPYHIILWRSLQKRSPNSR